MIKLAIIIFVLIWLSIYAGLYLSNLLSGPLSNIQVGGYGGSSSDEFNTEFEHVDDEYLQMFNSDTRIDFDSVKDINTKSSIFPTLRVYREYVDNNELFQVKDDGGIIYHDRHGNEHSFKREDVFEMVRNKVR